MAGSETREDLVQLTVAAYGAAPDAPLMRELKAIVHGDGALLDAAAVLTSGERWAALYPPSWTPAEFADAWLGALLPEADPDLLAFGREVAVAHLDAGGAPAGLVAAAQEFLSGPAASADFAASARAFLERSDAAMAELARSETVEDIVQLAVAAYYAAPGAALVDDMEAIIDGGGTLLDVAEAMTSGERWEALYPPSWTPAEFSDAWLRFLLPGADAELLASGRGIVVPHLEAGGAPAELLLRAQDLLSGSAVPAELAGFARGFLFSSDVAWEHSVVRGQDGAPAELEGVLATGCGCGPPGGGAAGPAVLILGAAGADIAGSPDAGDAVRVREAGFAPALVEAAPVEADSGGGIDRPRIQASLHPIGGWEDGRIAIVGGAGGADARDVSFAAHAGQIPDFGG